MTDHTTLWNKGWCVHGATGLGVAPSSTAMAAQVRRRAALRSANVLSAPGAACAAPLAGFVPGTGWPEPGGFMPREALKMVGLVAAEGLCGMAVVEVSPPYDCSDITSPMALRVCCVGLLGSMVAHGKMGAHKAIIDKPFHALPIRFLDPRQIRARQQPRAQRWRARG